MKYKLAKVLIVLTILVTLLFIKEVAAGDVNHCTEQEIQMFSDCYGITFWDQYYLDWCYQYDYNTDGVINLIDAGYFAQQCYADPEPICSEGTIEMFMAAYEMGLPSADLNEDGIVNELDLLMFQEMCEI